jgi:hypothetical protein
MWNAPSNEELNEIPRLYGTEKIPLPEKPIYLHLFFQNCDWYIVEYDGSDIFWGFAIMGGDLVNAEWGYISLGELKSLKHIGLEVDRDLYWKVRPAIEVEKIRVAWCHSHWKRNMPDGYMGGDSLEGVTV